MNHVGSVMDACVRRTCVGSLITKLLRAPLTISAKSATGVQDDNARHGLRFHV